MNRRRSDLLLVTRRTPLVLGLALLILVALASTGWAAWSASQSIGLTSWFEAAQATATPTRTPRPVTPTPTAVPVALIIAAPTATPLPTAAPTSMPDPQASSEEAMPAWLADVVQQYGMDPARRFVVVDLDMQLMTIWEPDQPLREMPVSTGDESRGYRTLAWYGLVGDYWGTFNSFGVYADEGWYLFEDAGSILIHGAPYRIVDGRKVYDDLHALGSYPASRGCIRLSSEDAIWFTEWQPKGVPLVIVPSAARQTPAP